MTIWLWDILAFNPQFMSLSSVTVFAATVLGRWKHAFNPQFMSLSSVTYVQKKVEEAIDTFNPQFMSLSSVTAPRYVLSYA